MKKTLLLTLLALAGCTTVPSELTLTEGEAWTSRKDYADFEITGEARTGDGAEAILRFCQADGREGYGVVLRNGSIDGTVTMRSAASPSSSASRARAADERRPSPRRPWASLSTCSRTR